MFLENLRASLIIKLRSTKLQFALLTFDKLLCTFNVTNINIY